MPEPFRCTKPNWHTWHCRLGHPGQDLTSDIINGGCATGIISHDPNTKLICPSCLVGKHAQKPFEQNGNRAQFVNELSHINTCGPFPTASPQGARYFFAMLEDKTTAVEVKMMKRKNEAFRHFETTVAKWERISGRPVMFMRSDNAPEFVESDMGKFLRQKGIRHQQCVPYAHQQNGKIECFIHTIEERALTLLAHSGLPASFLADTILTVAYLYMWLPNSSIPKDTTPFEQLYSKKPDLSHLRVWGCRCWVTIPQEKRTKGGPKMFEAIFVHYEDDRIGWWVRDLKGKYHFSRDVEFDEDTPGKLSSKRHMLDPPSDISPDVSLPDNSLPTDPPPNVRPSRSVKATEKGHRMAIATFTNSRKC